MPSSAAASAAYENADLKRERQTCSFDKEEMTNIIDGGADKTAERRELGTSVERRATFNY